MVYTQVAGLFATFFLTRRSIVSAVPGSRTIAFVRASRAIRGGAALLALLAAPLLFSGCGPGGDKKGTTVKGVLQMDGKPLEVSDGSTPGARAMINVYVSLVKGEKDFTTEATADGKFTIEGVEAGDYTLTVRQVDRLSLSTKGGPGAGGAKGAGGPGATGSGTTGSGPPDQDKLGGEFSAAKSQIKVKVGTTSPQDLGTIDLKKPDTWPK
jgi:hypothetical protein